MLYPLAPSVPAGLRLKALHFVHTLINCVVLYRSDNKQQLFPVESHIGFSVGKTLSHL
jgi:hypothetical protein